MTTLKPWASRALAAVATISAAVVLSACGAPVKSAGDVAGMFAGSGKTIGERVRGLCAELDARTVAPTLEGIALSDSDCADAGKRAQDYKSVTAFAFEGISQDSIGGERARDKVLRIRTRGQVWLNRSLLGLASLAGNALKDTKVEVGLEVPAESDPNNEMAGLAKVTTTLLKKPEFNAETFEFSTAILLRMSGIAKVENQLDISGKLIDNAIVVRIDSPEKQPFAESILESMTVLAMVVPYAGDVYVDLFFDLNVHSIGADSLVASQLNGALGGGVKTLLDSLAKLK